MSTRNIFLNNMALSEAKELWKNRLEQSGFLGNSPIKEIAVDDSLVA